MKSINRAIFIIATMLLQILWADTTTLALQNGLYKYTGCVDANICDKYAMDASNFKISISYCIS